jgi:hypothetical protein
MFYNHQCAAFACKSSFGRASADCAAKAGRVEPRHTAVIRSSGGVVRLRSRMRAYLRSGGRALVLTRFTSEWQWRMGVAVALSTVPFAAVSGTVRPRVGQRSMRSGGWQ